MRSRELSAAANCNSWFVPLLLVVGAACSSGEDTDRPKAAVALTQQVATPESVAVAAMRRGPLEAIAEYVAWDTAGRFVCGGCDPAIDRAHMLYLCQEPENACESMVPGSDYGYVTTSYHLHLVARSADSATVSVGYRVIGKFGGWGFTPRDSGAYDWVVHLRKVAGLWRIHGPLQVEVVSPTFAMTKMPSRADSLALLAAASDTASVRR